MRQRLTSTDLSIEDLLSGAYVFTIPAYQRDYAWTSNEAGQLLDDLSAVLDDVERDGTETPYFLGAMLLVAADAGPGPGAPRQAEVVDGQQRLITLAIVLAVLRDLAEGEDAAAIERLLSRPADGGGRAYHLRLRAGEDAFLLAAIQAQGASRSSQPREIIGASIARRNIEDVRRAVRAELRDRTPQMRRKLAELIRRHVRVLVVTTDDFDYAYQIFLTINDRGKRLSVEDIFRGEILGPLDREQRRRFEAIIDEMEKYRDEAEPNRTKGKTFFSHLATIDGWPRRGIIASLKRAVERRGGPRRFVAEVFAPMAEGYLQIRGAPGAAPLPPGVAHWLLALRWLEQHGDDDWVPVAMAILTRLAGDSAQMESFLRQLDRFAHGLMVLGCGREARRKHYAPVIRRLMEGAALPPAAELLAITPRNQRSILRNLATRLHMIDAATAKLVLVRADQALTGRPLESYREAIERDRRSPQRFTVEHVCPKGDEVANGEWLALFPRKSARQRAAQCIGNLALVTEAQNRRSSQKDFAAKLQLFFGDDQQVSPFELTEMLRAERVWDGSAIARRYHVVMGALKDLWSLQGPLPPCPALGNAPAAPRLPIDPPPDADAVAPDRS